MGEWIVPCNPAYYNVEEAFSELKRLNWKQDSPKVKAGDIVYVYVTKPVMAIRYKCKVNKVNLQFREIDDTKYIVNGTPYEIFPKHMELELIKKFNDELTYAIMVQHGVKGYIQKARKACPELLDYIDGIS